jgi:carbohydrate-binding DOMON domain-containing protein
MGQLNGWVERGKTESKTETTTSTKTSTETTTKTLTTTETGTQTRSQPTTRPKAQGYTFDRWKLSKEYGRKCFLEALKSQYRKETPQKT